MYEFFSAAFPWVAMAIALAVTAVWDNEKNND